MVPGAGNNVGGASSPYHREEVLLNLGKAEACLGSEVQQSGTTYPERI